MPLRLALAAMGTRFEAVLAGGPDPFLRAAGEAALAEIEQWDRRLSLFRADSTLAHVNRNAGDRAVAVDVELFELLLACRDLHAATRGAFDPTVAPLMRSLGLHSAPQWDRPPGGSAACIGFDGVELEEARRRVRFTRPGTAMDLGSIAKGHALDAAARVLIDAGVACALLQGGTSGAVSIGAPPGQDAWTIRIPPPLHGRAGEGLAACSPASRVKHQPPRSPPEGGVNPPPLEGRAGEGLETAHPTEHAGLLVALRNESLSVSAPSGRSVPGRDGPITHILDPRTGRPARGVGIVAVVAPSARDADAWSTALLVDPALADAAPATLAWALRRDGTPGWAVGGPERFVIGVPAGAAENL